MSSKIRFCVISLFTLFVISVSNTQSTIDDLFYRVIFKMLSDHYGKAVSSSDLSVYSEIENDQIWVKTFICNIGNITIVVDSIHFKVICIDDDQSCILYNGFKPPPPWDKMKTDKSWICNYWLQN
jgi:hypothetical protein